jgi:uncharacterized protein (DUF433 family)
MAPASTTDQTEPSLDDRACDVVTKMRGVCGGRACVAGTRITVWGLIAHKNLGVPERAILAAVPSLTPKQLSAALRYADENAAEIARDIAENEAGG